MDMEQQVGVMSFSDVCDEYASRKREMHVRQLQFAVMKATFNDDRRRYEAIVAMLKRPHFQFERGLRCVSTAVSAVQVLLTVASLFAVSAAAPWVWARATPLGRHNVTDELAAEISIPAAVVALLCFIASGLVVLAAGRMRRALLGKNPVELFHSFTLANTVCVSAPLRYIDPQQGEKDSNLFVTRKNWQWLEQESRCQLVKRGFWAVLLMSSAFSGLFMTLTGGFDVFEFDEPDGAYAEVIFGGLALLLVPMILFCCCVRGRGEMPDELGRLNNKDELFGHLNVPYQDPESSVSGDVDAASLDAVRRGDYLRV